MDPSHLFWQGIDPVAAIEWLGPLVFHAAAKDTRINDNCKIYGVLDERFTRIPLDQNPTGLGGTTCGEQVAGGLGVGLRRRRPRPRHRILGAVPASALERVDPDMAVNIEHEDVELGPLEGLASRRGDAQGRQLRDRRRLTPSGLVEQRLGEASRDHISQAIRQGDTQTGALKYYCPNKLG